MKDFTGKIAVITGAGCGIGRALALALAREGSILCLSDVDATRVSATAAECRRHGGSVLAHRLDVADRDAVRRYADTVADECGTVNLVVNNAGVAVTATVEQLSWTDADWLMGVDFWGVLHGTKAFLPHLIASGDGHLVTISSVFGFVGVPAHSAYNAAKFAVRGFTEALRQEMLIARHPVRVSCVHPGGVATNIARDGRYADPAVAADAHRRFQRIARTTPEQAARVILRGIRRGKPRILVGVDAYLIDVAARVLGPHYQRPYAALVRARTRPLSRGS